MSKGVSAEAARQRISRVKEPVRRLGRIRFPRNERFVFLKEHSGTERFYEAFLEACDSTNSAYGGVLHVLRARGGVCLDPQFGVLSGCPTARRRQISMSRLKDDLLSLGAISQGSLDSRPALRLTELLHGDDSPIVRARLIAEEVLLSHVSEWLRRMNLVSWGALKARGGADVPEFGGFHFDVVGPCYLRPIAERGAEGPAPGFTVADLHLGFEMDTKSIKYFVRKLQIARSGKSRPVLGILVAEGFSNDAWRLGRSEGLLVTTPEILFGKSVSEALSEVISTLANAAAAATKNPEVVPRLFERLGGIEGAAANLRGPLFELIVGHLVSGEGGSIDIGRMAFKKEGTASADIDVLRVRRTDVHAYECKGHSPGHEVTLETVREWMNKKVPIMRDWLINREELRDLPHCFEFWTTATFSQSAIEFLTTAQARLKKFRIAWKDGDEVLALARASRNKRIAETLNEHYLRHPIATTIAGTMGRARSGTGRVQAAVATPPAVAVAAEKEAMTPPVVTTGSEKETVTTVTASDET
jgi:hypothetical protein